jgi:hypothetical protein
MVGMNLVNHQLPGQHSLRLKHFNLRLAGMRRVENHIFSMEEAGPAYRYSGAGFRSNETGAGRCAGGAHPGDAFSKLDERSRRSLLLPGILGKPEA